MRKWDLEMKYVYKEYIFHEFKGKTSWKKKKKPLSFLWNIFFSKSIHGKMPCWYKTLYLR